MQAETQVVFVNVYLTGVEKTVQNILANEVNIVIRVQLQMSAPNDMKARLLSMTNVNVERNIQDKTATSTQVTVFLADPFVTHLTTVLYASVTILYYMVHVHLTK